MFEKTKKRFLSFVTDIDLWLMEKGITKAKPYFRLKCESFVYDNPFMFVYESFFKNPFIYHSDDHSETFTQNAKRNGLRI